MKSFAFVLLFLNFSGTIINARFYTRQYVDRLSIENDRFNGDADNRNFENAPFDEVRFRLLVSVNFKLYLMSSFSMQPRNMPKRINSGMRMLQ